MAFTFYNSGKQEVLVKDLDSVPFSWIFCNGASNAATLTLSEHQDLTGVVSTTGDYPGGLVGQPGQYTDPTILTIGSDVEWRNETASYQYTNFDATAAGSIEYWVLIIRNTTNITADARLVGFETFSPVVTGDGITLDVNFTDVNNNVWTTS